MSKRKSDADEECRKRSKKNQNIEYDIDNPDNEYDELVLLPDPDDSGASDNNDSDNDESNEENEVNEFNDLLYQKSYEKVYSNYNEKQSKLENHNYNWVDGEKVYSDEVTDNLLLTDKDKKKVLDSTPVELFEMFFCTNIKKYIIDATLENGYKLSLLLLNAFIGIIIFSSFNKRKSQNDYWSKDPFLSSEVVKSTMSRDQFKKSNKKLNIQNQ